MMKPSFVKMILDDVFSEADSDGDGVISEAEWIRSAGSSNNIKMLIDPNNCTEEWKKFFD